MGDDDEGGDVDSFFGEEYCLLLEWIVILDLVMGFGGFLEVMLVWIWG